MAAGADIEAADLGLTKLPGRHISELHELAVAAGVPRFRTLRREELSRAIEAAALAAVDDVSQPPVETYPRPPDGARVYAILRISGEAPDDVTVEKVVSSEDEAERETQRLNTLAGGEAYLWRVTSYYGR